MASVAGISPFNFPVTPGLATKPVLQSLVETAIIIKPATDTPLSALKLVELFLEAGTPPEAIQCVTGPGGEIGDTLCAGPTRPERLRFTGSRDVGEHICRVAGLKRVYDGTRIEFTAYRDA